MSILWENKPKYMETAVTWGDAQEIAAGTPVDAAGAVANDETAIGILAETINRPWSGKMKVIVAGFVDIDAAEESSGLTISAAAKKAMHGIKFVSEGVIEPIPDDAPTYTLPAATADAMGGVLQGEAVADATSETAATQINALIASLVASGALAEYIPPEPAVEE